MSWSQWDCLLELIGNQFNDSGEFSMGTLLYMLTTVSPRLCLISCLFLCGVKFQVGWGGQKWKRHRLPVWSLICPQQEISRFASVSQ